MNDAEKIQKEATRKAKNRLEVVRTQEVSLVDHGANLAMIVLRKNDDTRGKMDPENTTKDDGAAPGDAPAGSAPAAAPAMSMPQGAKDAILQLCATVIDAMSKVGDAAQAATPDEAATVPADLVGTLGQVAEMIEAVEAQYGDASAVTQAAPPVAPGGDDKPEDDEAKKSSEFAIEVAKAIVVEDKQYANSTQPEIPFRIAKRMAPAVAAVIAKAGRKIASSRLAMLKQVSQLIGTLVKEVDDESSAASPGAGAAAPAPAPAPAPVTAGAPASAAGAAPAGSPAAVSKSAAAEPHAAELAELKKQLDGALVKFNDFISGQKAGMELVAKVNKALEMGAAPSSSTADNGVPVGKGLLPTIATDTPWPRDLSAVAKAELDAEKKKNGAAPSR